MSRRRMDLTGRRFGRLTVQTEATPHIYPSGQSQRQWECLCDCGNTATVAQFALIQGITQSCGCLRKERSRETASGKNSKNPLQRTNGTTIPLIRPGRKPYRNSKSGVIGVYYDKSVNKWCAQIELKGQNRILGKFARKEDAIAARKRAEEEYFAPIVEAFDAERQKEDENGS